MLRTDQRFLNAHLGERKASDKQKCKRLDQQALQFLTDRPALNVMCQNPNPATSEMPIGRPGRCNDFQERNTRKYYIRGLSCHNKMLLVNRCFVPTKIIRGFLEPETGPHTWSKTICAIFGSVCASWVCFYAANASKEPSHFTCTQRDDLANPTLPNNPTPNPTHPTLL